MRFLTIENGTLTLKFKGMGGEVVIIATGVAAVREALEDGEEYFVSSSIDFPEEDTTDPEIIAFCKSIREW